MSRRRDQRNEVPAVAMSRRGNLAVAVTRSGRVRPASARLRPPLLSNHARQLGARRRGHAGVTPHRGQGSANRAARPYPRDQRVQGDPSRKHHRATADRLDRRRAAERSRVRRRQSAARGPLVRNVASAIRPHRERPLRDALDRRAQSPRSGAWAYHDSSAVPSGHARSRRGTSRAPCGLSRRCSAAIGVSRRGCPPACRGPVRPPRVGRDADRRWEPYGDRARDEAPRRSGRPSPNRAEASRRSDRGVPASRGRHPDEPAGCR
jgi:hypothetical protein